MQAPATFDLDAVKAKVEEAIKAREGQYSRLRRSGRLRLGPPLRDLTRGGRRITKKPRWPRRWPTLARAAMKTQVGGAQAKLLDAPMSAAWERVSLRGQ